MKKVLRVSGIAAVIVGSVARNLCRIQTGKERQSD
jgi:hypothetical protein